MTDKRRRRHHLVSAFYLRGFANSDGRLFRTPLNGRPPHPIAVNDATVVTDYYSVELEDGPSDYFERLFAEIEAPAAAALRTLLADDFPTGDEREAFAMWAALQYLRSDSMRRRGTEQLTMMIRLVVGISGMESLREFIEEKEGAAVSDARLRAEWDDLTKSAGPTLKPDPAQHLGTIMRLLPGTAAMFNDSPWQIFRSTKHPFVTTDHPAFLVPEPDAPGWQGVGLANAAALGLPLSRTHALMIQLSGAASGAPDTGWSLSADNVRSLNYAIISEARQAIYHHPSDRPSEWFGGLPDPRDQEVQMVSGDGLISEEGLGGKLPASTIPGDSSQGFSLPDVPWPIPDRIFDWSEE